jgi:predicted DNA-binding protein (MmcQ/YjbR family)
MIGTASPATAGVSCAAKVATARERLLAFSLSLPEAYEDHPWGESVAKVRGKVFVFFGADRSQTPRMTAKLDESHGHAMSIDGAEPTGYGLGKSGWVTVPLDAEDVDVEILSDWIEESYRIIAPKRLVAELDRGTLGAAKAK